jgi:hypothetical protein
MIKDGELEFNRKWSIIAFNRDSERKTFIALKRERTTNSSMSMKDIEESLNKGLGISLEHLITKLSSIKFYDSEPPLVYTMSILWDTFAGKITMQQRRESREGQKTIEIKVNVSVLQDELYKQFAFCQSSEYQKKIPDKEWVKRAMDSFVDIGLAEKSKINSEDYTVKFRKIPRKKSIEFFIEKLYMKGKKEKKEKQMDLKSIIK